MSTKYEYYDTGYDTNWRIDNGEGRWLGQLFTPSVAHTITSVKLYMKRVGNPSGNLNVEIQGVSGGHPDGITLASGTLACSSISTNPTLAWYEITLGAGYALSNGVQYAIVIYLDAGDVSNYIYVGEDGSSATYAGGNLEYSSDSGSSWTSNTGWDVNFEEWGDPAESSYDTAVGSKNTWGWEKVTFGGAEQCPVGDKNAWAWAAPTAGSDETRQGDKNSWAWGTT